ncbi:hypothetical protein HRbin39_01254 [bacterium HR39]|nr:hypothetical protein HRbin39_01254 [bacterium HR39]
MKKSGRKNEEYLRVGATLPPHRRPGRDLLLRVTEEMGPTAVATRDLGRYYALLEAALRGLRGRFTSRELSALAYALQSMALVEVPDLLYLAPEAVEESVELEDLCGMTGLSPEECEAFRKKVESLELAEAFALVDAVGRYLEGGGGGEEAWRSLGLL